MIYVQRYSKTLTKKNFLKITDKVIRVIVETLLSYPVSVTSSKLMKNEGY